MSQPSTSPVTMTSLSRGVETSVASAKEEEARRLVEIAKRTYDHLESRKLFRPHRRDLHPVGDSVMYDCQQKLRAEEEQARATDDQTTEVLMVDSESWRISAQDDNTTRHELKDVTRDELEEVAEMFFQATYGLYAVEKSKQKEDEEKHRGRDLLQDGTKPLGELLDGINEGINEVHSVWVPPD
jgi:hypothetical protein